MGEDKLADPEYIRDLGKRIERSGGQTMPSASGLAAEAQEIMMGAGQAGGILPALSFFFGAEYIEQSCKVKNDVAAEINDTAQANAKFWKETDEAARFETD